MYQPFSPAAFDLIIRAETGGKPPSVKTRTDSKGRAIIGYGHVIQPGQHGLGVVGTEKARTFLSRDLTRAATWLGKQLPLVPRLPPHQWDALCCWALQAIDGSAESLNEVPETSLLLHYLKTGMPQLAAAEFNNWVYFDGRMRRALAVRRQMEFRLFTGT